MLQNKQRSSSFKKIRDKEKQNKGNQLKIELKLNNRPEQHLSLDRSTILDMTDQFDAKVTLSKRLKIDPDCNSKSALELVAKKTKVQNKNKQKPSVKFNIKEPQERESNDK